MDWDALWEYPYRLGIGIFIVVGTVFFMAIFLGFTIWLERYYKKEREKS